MGSTGATGSTGPTGTTSPSAELLIAVGINFLSPSFASVTVIPQNAIVTRCDVVIDIPWNVGATIEVGDSSNATKFQTAADNNPAVSNTYSKLQESQLAAAASTVRIAVAGATAGSADVYVYYVIAAQP